ncbi:sugar ABC transporter permease [Falsigemmobacter faecalis]|uniref:Transport permease protein n=2 Tax=Falsigemmobacter faecalis TaxID=2488730 RepID=A0A3P3DAG2_9RHOB|nr:sugar ABC transporter permease [Falsigemmobacter faecalis]
MSGGRAVPQRPGAPRFRAFRAISALMLREMATRYGRSPGGYIWAVLDPLGTILLLSLAMSFLIQSPPLGVSFVLFKATGMMPFAIYGSLSGAASSAISFSRPLLRYPGVTWMDALLARVLMNFLTTVLVAVLIFAGVLLWSDTRTLLDFPLILLAMALAALFGTGVGVCNIVFFMRYPAWEHTWAILNRPMLLASGVLFLFESMPRAVQEILWYNPLVHIIALMREGFYPMYHASWVSVPFVLVTALLPLAAGLLLVRHHHVDLLNL